MLTSAHSLRVTRTETIRAADSGSRPPSEWRRSRNEPVQVRSWDVPDVGALSAPISGRPACFGSCGVRYCGSDVLQVAGIRVSYREALRVRISSIPRNYYFLKQEHKSLRKKILKTSTETGCDTDEREQPVGGGCLSHLALSTVFLVNGMDRMLEKIQGMIPADLSERLDPEHGREIQFLLSSYDKFKTGQATAGDLLFDSKVVIDRTWELLNVGRWVDVPERRRQVYGIAAVLHAIALLKEGQENSVAKSLEVIDLGILLGLPFQGIILTEIADMLSAHIAPAESVRQRESPSPSREEGGRETKKIKLTNEIDTCSRPSIEFFFKNYLAKKEPVKMTDCIDHWPALKLWTDLNYLKRKAGSRTVPIEIGRHYADSSYRQKLMKVSDFIDEFFSDRATDIGYLAQHQLFDQVPELKKDISEPEYCCISDKDEPSTDTDVNAWFGPKGTVSPLHFDPKHNVLCQVVGSKKIILYPESDSEFLYPREGLLSNTSQVDVENPNLEEFPLFSKAVRSECLLHPGEILYIPPKCWHHVRALDNSFSVSFWWQ